MRTGVATYYDRLGRWNRIAAAVGYGGGSSSLTVHRALADPRENGRATFSRLHDVIIDAVSDLRRPRVLDAGCGLGGTMLALASACDAACTGLTLSRTQAETANAAAARAERADSVHAVVGNYDGPPPGPFDLVVCIESLAHSQDPARSVSVLSATLAPGGRLLIVDDMPEASALGTRDLELFRAGWQCPVLFSRADYLRAFSACGLTCASDVDLSADARPRTLPAIALLMGLNRMARVVPAASWRQVMDSHLGGLALERLTREGHVHYRMLVARKPELRVS